MAQMDDLERVLKALANKRRLGIAAFVKRRKQATVGRIAKEIGLSFRSTSKHLSVLRSAGILEREQSGLEMIYFVLPRQTPAAQHILDLI